MFDLWLQPVDEATVHWATAESAVLDQDETRRWRRYRTQDARTLFLVAHVVTRHVLSRYGDRAPESWRFDIGAHGRPEIVSPTMDMRFNLSHTDGMIAVLVHDEADCGVDVEHVSRPMDMRSVSRRVFTEAERDAMFLLPARSQADCFFQLWTLKEAFIKAKGRGMALPLQRFSFALTNGSGGAPIGFACDPSIDPDPDRWHFGTHRLSSGHIVSTAAHQGAASNNRPAIIRHLEIES